MAQILVYLSILRKKAFMLIIGVAIFYMVLAIYSDSNQLNTHLQKVEGWLIIPILSSFTLAAFIKGIRQLFFLRTIGIKINLRQSTIIYFAGLSMLFTPGGMGQIVKSRFLLKNYSQPILKTIPVTIIERYHDALALFSFITIFSFLENITILRIPTFIFGMVLLLGALIIKNRKLLDYFERKSNRVRSLVLRFGKSSSEFNNTLHCLSAKENIFYGWLMSMAAWSLDAVGIFLCFEAFRLSFNFGTTTALGFSSILFGALSLVPGGTGVTELSFVHLLSTYGVEISTATSLVLFIRLSSIWYTSCIGLVMMKIVLRKNSSELIRNKSQSLKLNKEVFELGELISRVVERFVRHLDKSIDDSSPEIRLQYEPNNRAIFVEADKDGMVRVISNLISDAIEFTRHGTVSVTVEKKQNIDNRDQEVIIAVKDDSCWLDSGCRHGIVTSLEWSDSKRFVEAHGGRMWFEDGSEGTHGPTFKFTVPLARKIRR